jgi:hypothetical protein
VTLRDVATRPVAVVAGHAQSVGRAASLVEAGHEVVLVGPPALRAACPEGASFVEPVALEVEVTPPYLTDSYALYGALRGQDFGAIVFPDDGALGYCSTRAKEIGADFGATAVVIDCIEPTLFQVERERRPFLSKRTLGVGIAERLTLELADGFICDDDAVAGWLGEQGWSLPPRVESVALPSGERAQPPQAQRPLVSVVIAYHERTEYLRFCLEGLARQTYSALEVVVADDGSRSDAAREQLADIETRSWPWPLRIVHLEHGGLASARNGGWQVADGELVVFVDDDDVPFDDMVETLWNARSRSGADYVVGGARFFRGDGEPTARRGDVVRISLCNPHELGLLSNQYGGPVNLWSRELLERLEGFASVPLEEWDLLARAVLVGARATTPPDPVYWYRQTPGGMYSSDPLAFRDAGIAQLSARFGERLPRELRLLPLLAAGGYAELERRGRRTRPRLETLGARGRLLLRRAAEVHEDGGWPAVARRAARFARRTIAGR